MQVDGYVQACCGVQDGCAVGVVEEAALGGAVDEGADEAELGDAVLELRDGGVDVPGGQCGEAGEAVRVRGDGVVQCAVEPAGQG